MEPRSHFVNAAEVTRLSLSDGHYVDVKRRLSHGEREEMFARMRPTPDEWQHVRTAKVNAYLVGWSLVGLDGKPAPMAPTMKKDERLATLGALDPDDFEEIYDAIEEHEKTVQAARDAEKNARAGKLPSTATLPSA